MTAGPQINLPLVLLRVTAKFADTHSRDMLKKALLHHCIPIMLQYAPTPRSTDGGGYKLEGVEELRSLPLVSRELNNIPTPLLF
jgi:hypothetical protein